MTPVAGSTPLDHDLLRRIRVPLSAMCVSSRKTAPQRSTMQDIALTRYVRNSCGLRNSATTVWTVAEPTQSLIGRKRQPVNIELIVLPSTRLASTLLYSPCCRPFRSRSLRNVVNECTPVDRPAATCASCMRHASTHVSEFIRLCRTSANLVLLQVFQRLNLTALHGVLEPRSSRFCMATNQVEVPAFQVPVYKVYLVSATARFFSRNLNAGEFSKPSET